MTWYVTDLDRISRQPRRDRRRPGRRSWARIIPAMAVVEVEALVERAALIEIETTAVVPEVSRRQLRPRPPAAAGAAARIPFDLPELQYPERLNAAVELIEGRRSGRARDGQRPAAGPMARSTTSPTASPGCWSRRKGWCPATACCCAGRTADAVRRLARRAQGRRHRRRDHADAAPRRDRDHARARPDQPRHRRQPLPRRFPRRRWSRRISSSAHL